MKITPFIMALGLACVTLVSSPLNAAIPAGTDSSAVNKGSDNDYRNRSFRAYLPQEEVRKSLKVNNYSGFENPTGIYFKAGDTATVTLKGSIPAGVTPKLIVHDFGPSGAHAEFPLKLGVNELKLSKPGLAYFDYRSTTPANCKALEVGIQGGEINGLFSKGDSNETWKKLLSNTKCEMIDLVGERVQLIYHVGELRKHCPDKGKELLDVYDEIMRLEQEDIMGLSKYKKHPGNHILGRNVWNGYMHADGMGAAFHFNTSAGVGNPVNAARDSWGIAHEFGHVNQTRPGMMWVGTCEVTTNIFSNWVNYKLNPGNMRLEHEVTPSPNGNIRGGRFHSYINSAIVEKQIWQFLQGPDSFNYAKNEPHGGGIAAHARGSDHFVNVCPMWQLQLYTAVAQGKKDFYPDIFEKVRNTNEKELTDGQMRVNFYKNACDAAGLNLTEFFVRTRMLVPLNRWKEDYSSSMLTITEEDVKKAIQGVQAKGYPMPDSSVIYYITANSAELFKAKKPVQKSSVPAIEKGKMVIAAGEWKNAVAFEVYAGKKLIGVSLLGLGHPDNVTTDVFVPEQATTVKAVGWDGKRTTMYSKK